MKNGNGKFCYDNVSLSCMGDKTNKRHILVVVLLLLFSISFDSLHELVCAKEAKVLGNNSMK